MEKNPKLRIFAWGAFGGLAVAAVALGLYWVSGIGDDDGAAAILERTAATESASTTTVTTAESTTTQVTTTTQATTTTTPATTATTAPPTTTTVAEIQPEQIYASTCAVCHGEDREGGIGPALGPGGHFANHDDAELIALISGGRDEMPAFEGVLTPEEITALIDWLRSGLLDE